MCYQESNGSAAQGYMVGIIDTLWPIIFVLIISILFWIYRNKIRESKARLYLPYIFLGIMIIFEISLFVTIVKAPFVPLCDTLTHLPLHLCASSAVLIIVYLISKKEFVLKIMFMQGIVGALVTFVFPSTGSFPYEYDYWRFFLSHAMLFIVPMYYFIIEGFRVNKRVLLYAFITAHVVAVLATTVNLIINHDYMYLLPDNSRNLYHFIPIHESIEFFGNWPGVILFGELLIFPVYFIFYGLFKWLGNVMDKKEE